MFLSEIALDVVPRQHDDRRAREHPQKPVELQQGVRPQRPSAARQHPHLQGHPRPQGKSQFQA